MVIKDYMHTNGFKLKPMQQSNILRCKLFLDQSVANKAMNWELKECGGLLVLYNAHSYTCTDTRAYTYTHAGTRTPTRAHTHTLAIYDELWWNWNAFNLDHLRLYSMIVTALWRYPPSVSVGPPQTFREHTPTRKVNASPYWSLLAFSMLCIQMLHIMNLLWPICPVGPSAQMERSPIHQKEVWPLQLWPLGLVCLIDSHFREREVGR
jgi:hypothetical protein